MTVTRYKIKKWYHMVTGNSVHHVNQDEGRIYSKDDIAGYYNNLTEKITRFGRADNEVPITPVDNGTEIEFSIAIFQYGLAAYDLYLLSASADRDALAKTLACADWALSHQQPNGAWRTFDYENAEYPYSAMAQGEAISLLLRAHKATGDARYLHAARRAKDFMLLPFEEGGPTKYVGRDVYLYECPRDPLILNGWIFSLWGLLDYRKATGDKEVADVLSRTLATLERDLPTYDLGYWSRYEDGPRIASPFYHRLHVAQLRVMYALTGREVYRRYARRWDRMAHNPLYRAIAFARKAWQKIMEK